MTEFVDDDLGWILWVDKQEHTHTQTAPAVPVGYGAAVEPVVGTLAVDAIDDCADEGLGKAPGPLPEPK